jgi:hypothetical protein
MVVVPTVIFAQPVWHSIVDAAMEIVGVVAQHASELGRYSVTVYSVAQSGWTLGHSWVVAVPALRIGASVTPDDELEAVDGGAMKRETYVVVCMAR